jgi:hypothetical protein
MVLGMAFMISLQVQEHHFADYEELRGFEGRDIMFNMWYPRSLPGSNSDIHLKYSTDTDHSWSRSTCDWEDMAVIASALKEVTVEELLRNRSWRLLYRSANEQWWPEELSKEGIRDGVIGFRIFEVIEENEMSRGRMVNMFYLFLERDECTVYHWSPGVEVIVDRRGTT